MKCLLVIFVFISCATIPPNPQPIPSPPVVVHDTVIKTVTDTVFVSPIILDTASGIVLVLPSPSGDSWPQLQQGIILVIANPDFHLETVAGVYQISQPLLILNQVGSDYGFVSFRWIAPTSGKAAPLANCTVIEPIFSEGPAIVIQKGKGVVLENITVIGRFHFPDNLTQIQIDTLSFAAWDDGVCRQNRWSPECAIAIDPLSDPASLPTGAMYPKLISLYLPGMSRGGSTDVQILGCRVMDNVVGITFQSGTQQNGDACRISDCDIEFNKVGIAVCQDQIKELEIDRTKCWGGTHTFLDGVHYGAGTGGGAVNWHGANFAGFNYQIVNINTSRFPFAAYDIYAENVFRIGSVGNGAGSTFFNLVADLSPGGGLPIPDHTLFGTATLIGGGIRYYNLDSNTRMNLSNANLTFKDGMIGTPPILISLSGYGQDYYPTPYLDNEKIYYSQKFGGVLNRRTSMAASFFIGIDPPTNYETVDTLGVVNYTVNKLMWTATCTGPTAPIGSYIITASIPNYADPTENPGINPTTVLGRVVSVSGSTMALDQVSVNSVSGQYRVYADRVSYLPSH